MTSGAYQLYARVGDMPNLFAMISSTLPRDDLSMTRELDDL